MARWRQWVPDGVTVEAVFLEKVGGEDTLDG